MPAARAPSPDALTLVRDDHRRLRQVFVEYLATPEDDPRRGPRRADLVRVVGEHLRWEDEGLYQQVRRRAPQLDREMLEALEEHHVVALLCAELTALPTGHETAEAKVSVLVESLTHHMEADEAHRFLVMRFALGAPALREIGEGLERMRAG